MTTIDELAKKIDEIHDSIKSSQQESLDSKVETETPKQVAHYQVILTAFIESRNDLDRQMLTISVAGLGSILAIFNTKDPSCFIKVGIIASSLLFLVNIFVLLRISSFNSDYLEAELAEADDLIKRLSRKMMLLDAASKLLFRSAIALFAITMIIDLIKK